jgi:glyoxylase-like metal-dependent hydrolase (beta-lactamase superfamily II)
VSHFRIASRNYESRLADGGLHHGRPQSAISHSIDTREVYALSYASMRGRRASELYFRYQLYGVEDRAVAMGCYFWLIRDGARVVLVDCGWNRDRALGPTGGRFDHVTLEQRDPVELLARLDVAPETVDHVIVSHMHIDHIGNLDLFPNATVSVARAELDCWTGPYGQSPALAHAVVRQDVEFVQQLADAGRVRIVDEPGEVLPGIAVAPVGGHSPGQMVIEIATGRGTVVLASDAAHYHEELEHDWPFYVYTDLLAALRGYEMLRAKAGQPNTWIVTGHDPVEMDRFPRVNADCVDLTAPPRSAAG